MMRLSALLLFALGSVAFDVPAAATPRSGAVQRPKRPERPVLRTTRFDWPGAFARELDRTADEHIRLTIGWSPIRRVQTLQYSGSRVDQAAIDDVTRFAAQHEVTVRIGADERTSLEGRGDAVIKVRNYLALRHGRYHSHLLSANGGYIYNGPVIEVLGRVE